MKYFIKQSSIFIVVSLMLCMINITYQETESKKYYKNFKYLAKNSLLETMKTKSYSKKTEIKTGNKAEIKISKTNLLTKEQIKSEKNSIKNEATTTVKEKTSAKTDAILSNKLNSFSETFRLKIPRGWVMIRGRRNLCIHATRKGRITQGACRKNNQNTLWKFMRIGRVYVIKNINGQVFDIFGGKKHNGAHIYSTDRTNKNNQKWRFIFLRGGKFELKNINSKKCLDNTGKAKIGIGYHQWDCNRRNKNQQFRFVRVRFNRRTPSVRRTKSNRRIKRITKSIRRIKRSTKSIRRIKSNRRTKSIRRIKSNRRTKSNRRIKSNRRTKGRKSIRSFNSKVPKGWGMIKGHKNLCIYVTSRARITQGTCLKDNVKTLWRFIRIKKHYIIKNKNGLVFDVNGSKKHNGAHIYSTDRTNKNNQKWKFLSLRRKKFELKNINSNKCLDNTGKAKIGIGYHQWDCNRRNKNQQFRFVKVNLKKNKAKIAKIKALRAKRKAAKLQDISKKTTIKIPKGKVFLSSLNNLCIKYKGYRKKVVQHKCLKNSLTLWELVNVSGDTYGIKNSLDKFLSVGKGKKNGSTVSSLNKSGKYDQHWTLLKAKDGKYLIQNRLSRKCLDNTGLARLNRVYWTWSCNENNKNQQFKIISENEKPPKFISKIVKNPKSKKFVKSVKRVIRSGKLKVAKKLIKKLKNSGRKKAARKLKKIAKKAARKIKRATKIVKKRIAKLIEKGKNNKAKKLKKIVKKMKKVVKKMKKGKNKGKNNKGNKGNKGKKGKKRPNSGYRKKKNIKFLNGKYKFNLETGREFCSEKCKPNRDAVEKQCFKGTIQSCNSCVFKGDKKIEQNSEELCKTVCNAIKTEKNCEFYAYIENKEKIINKKLLNRFGRIFIKKFLKINK